MMYSNLKCIALAIMLFMTLSSFGQRQIKYVYDGAGNRIKRIGFVDRSYRQVSPPIAIICPGIFCKLE